VGSWVGELACKGLVARSALANFRGLGSVAAFARRGLPRSDAGDGRAQRGRGVNATPPAAFAFRERVRDGRAQRGRAVAPSRSRFALRRGVDQSNNKKDKTRIKRIRRKNSKKTRLNSMACEQKIARPAPYSYHQGRFLAYFRPPKNANWFICTGFLTFQK
jgi:hypothetical protein